MTKADTAKTKAEEVSVTVRPDPPKAAKSNASVPAAGPHAKAHLTNDAATPGAGALPSSTPAGSDVDGGVG